MSLVVAIAGGTGHIGQYITSALLASIPKPTVRLLTRSKTSAKVEQFAKEGAELRVVDYKDSSTVADALQGADVFISAIGTKGAGPEVKGQLMRTALGIDTMKIIIPSEFGIDHRSIDFAQPDWDLKKSVSDIITEQHVVKCVFVYTGLFMEDSFGPWFGMSTKEHRYETIGTDKRVTFTSLEDVGRATAVIALTSPLKIPNRLHLRLNGDTVTLREAAKIMEEESGEHIEVVQRDLDSFRAGVLAKPSPNAGDCLRFLMGEGKLDGSNDGGNEWVNPGSASWKWKTVRDYAKEVNGKPWPDF